MHWLQLAWHQTAEASQRITLRPGMHSAEAITQNMQVP